MAHACKPRTLQREALKEGSVEGFKRHTLSIPEPWDCLKPQLWTLKLLALKMCEGATSRPGSAGRESKLRGSRLEGLGVRG